MISWNIETIEAVLTLVADEGDGRKGICAYPFFEKGSWGGWLLPFLAWSGLFKKADGSGLSFEANQVKGQWLVKISTFGNPDLCIHFFFFLEKCTYWPCIAEEGRLEAFGNVKAGKGEYEIAWENLSSNMRFSFDGTMQADIPEMPIHPHFTSLN